MDKSTQDIDKYEATLSGDARERYRTVKRLMSNQPAEIPQATAHSAPASEPLTSEQAHEFLPRVGKIGVFTVRYGIIGPDGLVYGAVFGTLLAVRNIADDCFFTCTSRVNGVYVVIGNGTTVTVPLSSISGFVETNRAEVGGIHEIRVGEDGTTKRVHRSSPIFTADHVAVETPSEVAGDDGASI